MREIKFEYGFESVNGIVKKVYSLSEIPNIKDHCDVWNELPLKYVRESTGLKDKNGKEIYEGDIIEYDDYSRGACIGFSQHRTTGVIKIEGNLFGHIKLDGNGFSEPKNPIVIGNIHENKDLL